MTLAQRDWQLLLEDLKNRTLQDEQIGHAIVRIAKPLDANRVLMAKDTILGYLNHPNAWARHEAMWFINWAKLLECKAELISALRDDPEPDNRGFAALCLAHMLAGTTDKDAIRELKAKALDISEEKLVRLNCYGALLEVVLNRAGTSFYSGSPGLDEVNWEWVHQL
jgi:HEAT repeat protein